MKILVTGAGGFLGRHLTSARDAAGFETRGLDLPSTSHHPREGFIPCDLTDAASTRAALRGLSFDAVVHLAAASRTAPEAVAMRVAVEGTANLLAALGGDFGGFVLAGSSAVYGSVPAGDQPVVESRAPSPAGFYGAAHLSRERAVLDSLQGRVPAICIFRMFNLVGPGQEPVMLVPQVARKLALAEVGRPEPPLFTGSLEPKRDYVDVRDVAGAYVRWLSSGISGVHFLNICSGASTSGLDVVRALCVLFGQPAPDAAGLPRAEAGAVMDLTGDGRAALDLLGWSASTPLALSLEDTARDWRRRIRDRENRT